MQFGAAMPGGSGRLGGWRVLESMRWRLVGPHRGGRVVAVAGDPRDDQVFYFGACAGGVWKTVDGGWTWSNVSDGFFRTAAVGALAVADADPNVVYAGTGEACIRGNVSHGDGVYRSTDGGKTWRNVGLGDTRHIARVRVHPADPNLVYVAALGHAFGPNAERGVFRSRDGGRSWEKVLYRSPDAGAIDLALDVTNPRVLYASLYEVRRGPHFLSSGGPGSGLFKSVDGGDTWTELTDRPGLPKGLKGRIGLAVSPAMPDRVWAQVEAEDGGLFRSDDGGVTWRLMTDDRNLRQRAWYYSHIFADPQDPETVYALNVGMWKSTDGGKTFAAVATPHGDNHDLWIDPRNPRRMIEGNDGGACVSFTGGLSWSTLYNQPTAQFYHVTADSRFPYRLYGAQQDNTTLCVPSRSAKGAIMVTDCYPVGGGESGYIAVRPDNPDVVFAGGIKGQLTRYDHARGITRTVDIWPDNPAGWGVGDCRHRFQWTFPIVLSPHDPNVLYAAGECVFRSTDEGESWEAISPDLTRADPATMAASGGPITKDNSSAEYYATIFAFAESPLQRGLMWAGSDDGLIHVSRDGGQTWRNITPPASCLPEWALISIIEPSPHDPAVAYVAATRYKLDDTRPYLLKTSDYGETWESIVNGIPTWDFTRAIRADPERRGLLYAGTETGVYVSFDDGGSWQSLQGNLPVVPIHDLLVKDGDLVAATHGRSFWILDDLSPLRQMPADLGDVYLFQPRPGLRFQSGGRVRPEGGGVRDYAGPGGMVVTLRNRPKPDGDGVEVEVLDAGTNPPSGVVVHYYLREAAEVTLEFCEADGTLIKRFTSAAKQGPRVPATAGGNRFVWDMRYPDAEGVPGGLVLYGGTLTGPVAPPGSYQVRLTAGGRTLTAPFEIRRAPNVTASDADLRAQFDLLIRIRDKVSETHRAVAEIRSIRQQADTWVERAQGRPDAAALADAAAALRARLSAVEEELLQVKARARQDLLNFPIKLNNKLVLLGNVVASALHRPTRQSYEVYDDLAGRVDAQLGRLREIVATDVAEFAVRVREAGLPAMVTKL
jgi:photosystem II stability/assembly factor-like uncharacterized protein